MKDDIEVKEQVLAQPAAIPEEIRFRLGEAIRLYDLKEIQNIAMRHDIRQFRLHGHNAFLFLLGGRTPLTFNKIDLPARFNDPSYNHFFSPHKDDEKFYPFPRLKMDRYFGTSDLTDAIFSKESIQITLKRLSAWFCEQSEEKIAEKDKIFELIQIYKLAYLESIEKIEKIIDFFLEKGLSINEYPPEFGFNPLSQVVINAHISIGAIDLINYLISKGANPLEQSEFLSPLLMIVRLVEDFSKNDGYQQCSAEQILKIFSDNGVDLELKHTKKGSSFSSFLAQTIEGYRRRGDKVSDKLGYLLDLQEEATALKYNRSGTLSLFWQASKRLAIVIRDEEVTLLPPDVQGAVVAAKSFIR